MPNLHGDSVDTGNVDTGSSWNQGDHFMLSLVLIATIAKFESLKILF
jgi:hypothetical protein